MSILLLIPESTIDARDWLPTSAPDLDILQRMAERAAAAIANGHVTLDLNDRDLLDQIKSVGAVLPLGVGGVGLAEHVLGLGRVDRPRGGEGADRTSAAECGAGGGDGGR